MSPLTMLRRDLVDDAYCQGIAFHVSDTSQLAKAVALILIQEYVLARNILTGKTDETDGTPKFDGDDIEDIITRRLKPKDVYHRDGFLFQLMMWLAAHLDLEPGDLIALPHSQGSAKGQDSIVVHRAADAVVALTICEDKATESPRDTVRGDVWPEIKIYEKGWRLDELRSSVITTLGTGGVPTDEATRLTRGISWSGKRRYRVRVTIEIERSRQLFKGFDEIVSGANEMRRGETVLLPGMRAWMTELAGLIEANLRSHARE
jgi:hypothetical protein